MMLVPASSAVHVHVAQRGMHPVLYVVVQPYGEAKLELLPSCHMILDIYM